MFFFTTTPSKPDYYTEDKAKYVQPTVKGYDTDSLYRTYGGGSSGGGGGGYEVAKADISGLLASYDKQAETAKQNAETRYKNTREDLLKSLKRFQEENATNVKNQKQSYLTQQANLEGARALADRQNRISTSARGLGGSGLQQLAQLQNLLGQSEEISQAAGQNQTAMDKLATLLREYEEDNDTKMQQNEEERTNTLDTIASTLANQKASAIAANEQAYVNAVNQARAQAAALAAQASANNSAARQAANVLEGALNNWQRDAATELAGLNGKTKDQLKDKYGTTDINKIKNKIKDTYMKKITDPEKGLQANYGFGMDIQNAAEANLNSLLNGLSYSTIRVDKPSSSSTSYYMM